MKIQHNPVSPPTQRVSIMPEKPFPSHLKLHKLALAKAEMSGTVPLALFTRLATHSAVAVGLLASAEPLALQLRFGFDSEGWLVIKGYLSGKLPLVCQRCLEVIEQTVALSISLARVVSEQDMARFPSEYEPLVHAEESIEVIDLIEDDVLLSLPLVPMHNDETCAEGLLPLIPLTACDEAFEDSRERDEAEGVRDGAKGVEKDGAKTGEARLADSDSSRDNPFRVLEALKTTVDDDI
ncbi:MAG: YceD family protein [Gammaproteobacteria bacterium]